MARTITIGIDQGTYSFVNDTRVITLAEIDFEPTQAALAYVVNLTQKEEYYAPMSPFIRAEVSGLTITLTDESKATLKTNDILHIQFFYPENVQNPSPTNGDSVYVKDLDLEYCDNGNFSNSVKDLFNSLKTVNTDTTANDPKTIKIWFKRSTQIQSIGFGCDNLTKSFSNIVVKALGSGEAVRYTDDRYEDDSTKRNSFLIELPPLALNGILLEFHTTDEICLSNLIIFKATDINARIKAVSDLTGNVESVTSYRGALNVNPAYVHRKIVNEVFHQHTGTATNPTIAIIEGATSITVVSAVGFAIGDMIKLEDEVDGVGVQEIGVLTITNIVANIITVDRFIGNFYIIAVDVIKVITNMAVSASLASPESFKIDVPPGNIWQVTRLMLSMTDNLAFDDSKFGGGAALSNGISLRAVTAAGRTVVFANWKSNKDIKLDMFDFEYTDKAGGGNYGGHGRWSFNKLEIVAELDGDADPVQFLEALIQDDLTGQVSIILKGQGRVFSP